jgi:hypothetical protein
MVELNSRTYRVYMLEEQLEACRDGLDVPGLSAKQESVRQTEGLPSYYLPLKLIMESKCSIVKKFILGRRMRPIATRTLFTYLNALREEWEGFASLRLIWNEESLVSTDMLSYKVSTKFLATLRLGRFSELNVFREVYQTYMTKVKYREHPEEYCRSDITNNDKARTKYQFFMDRALSTVGFASVEVEGVVADSHSSVVDGLDDFLEEGEALEGSNKEMLHTHALSVLSIDEAEAAAQKRFTSFFTSTSPSFPFPAPFLAPDALAKHLLNYC